jgi:hypothetical protein
MQTPDFVRLPLYPSAEGGRVFEGLPGLSIKRPSRAPRIIRFIGEFAKNT